MSDLRRLFGEQLRELREQADLTQTQLAMASSMSRPTLVNIELGRQGVSLEQLYALAGGLKLKPENLLPSGIEQRTQVAEELAKMTSHDRDLVNKILSQGKG
jgi:transcriptional regulator with XRE-family HTH domain